MKSDIYLGLVHYPINNKRGEIVTTSVTNLDIHDIARSCRTFAIKKYFIITPLEAQHQLVERILGHWREDASLAYNPDRQDALCIAELAKSIDSAIESIKVIEGVAPFLVVTGANFKKNDGGWKEIKERLALDNRPILLLFGTGWGLNASVVERADFMFEPITCCGYNHLSVRSAVAIYLDRLRGCL